LADFPTNFLLVIALFLLMCVSLTQSIV